MVPADLLDGDDVAAAFFAAAGQVESDGDLARVLVAVLPVGGAGFWFVGAGVLLLAADPLADVVTDRAEVANQELVRIMLDAVLDSLPPYARMFLLAAPVGLVLLAASLWPHRRHELEEWPEERPEEAWQ